MPCFYFWYNKSVVERCLCTTWHHFSQKGLVFVFKRRRRLYIFGRFWLRLCNRVVVRDSCLFYHSLLLLIIAIEELNFPPGAETQPYSSSLRLPGVLNHTLPSPLYRGWTSSVSAPCNYSEDCSGLLWEKSTPGVLKDGKPFLLY